MPNRTFFPAKVALAMALVIAVYAGCPVLLQAAIRTQSPMATKPSSQAVARCQASAFDAQTQDYVERRLAELLQYRGIAAASLAATATVTATNPVTAARPTLSAPTSTTISTTSSALLPLTGKTIIVDAGHGGNDSGATADGIAERDINFEVAQELGRQLTVLGAKVEMTRKDKTFIELDERVRITSLIKPDAFVSDHCNYSPSHSAQGIEVYYHTDQSLPLASAVYQSLVATARAEGRFIQQKRFRVIKNSLVPAILVEMGYISNAGEREKLVTKDYQKLVAQGIATGVVQFLSGRVPAALSAIKRESAGSSKPLKRSTAKRKRSRKRK